MKKILFAVAAIVALSFSSCGRSANESANVDTLAVDTTDTVIVDTVVVDSTVCPD